MKMKTHVNVARWLRNAATVLVALTSSSAFAGSSSQQPVTAANAAATQNIPADGWYKIKNKALEKYLFNETANNPKNITYINETADWRKQYWYVTFKEDVATIIGSNGFTLARGNQSAKYASATAIFLTDLKLESVDDAGYFLFKDTHSTAQDVFTRNNAAYNNDTNPYILTTWTTEEAGNRYTFEAVDIPDGYTQYKVNITQPKGHENVACTLTLNDDTYKGNKMVYNGGFYFLTAAPATSSLTANELEGYDAEVKVEGNTISVKYTINKAGYMGILQNLITDAETAYALRGTGLGYHPGTNTTATKALSDAIAAAKAETEATIDGTEIATLQAALNAYNDPTNIELPVDGKAYVLVSLPNPSKTDHKETYINVKADGNTEFLEGTEYPASAKFIVRKIEGNKFVFVNGASNKYLKFKGVNEGYHADCGVTIKNLETGTNTVKLVVKRDNNNPNSAMIVKKSVTPNVWDQISGDDWTGSQDFSIRFRLVEVEYPNTPELKNASNLGTAVATWSAPFATVVPKGVMAYIVNSQSTSKVGVSYVAGEGEAIPANTGVLLGGAAGKATMVPATTETVAAVDGNLLEHSAGSTTTTVNGKYILADKSGKVAFYPVTSTETLGMNKAFLNLSGTSVREISFDFDATAIHDVEAKQNSMKTYDLSGRLVKKAGKGIFIRNGKKVILK